MIDGRQPNGRFAKNNAGGPGRPRRKVEAEYLQALRDSVTLDDWRAVCQRALDDAISGDCRAREWLSRYLLPADAGEVEPTDGQLLDERRLDAILEHLRTRELVGDSNDK